MLHHCRSASCCAVGTACRGSRIRAPAVPAASCGGATHNAAGGQLKQGTLAVRPSQSGRVHATCGTHSTQSTHQPAHLLGKAARQSGVADAVVAELLAQDLGGLLRRQVWGKGAEGW